jgi:hypothetical protein
MSAPPSKHKQDGAEETEENEEEVPSSSHSKSTVDRATPAADATTDDAVDDTEDLPDDFVHIQKTISGERRRRQSKQMHGIQDLLPFPFSPLIRPLTISDLESCIALENAAFANPAHRCSRDKVSFACA